MIGKKKWMFFLEGTPFKVSYSILLPVCQLISLYSPLGHFLGSDLRFLRLFLFCFGPSEPFFLVSWPLCWVHLQFSFSLFSFYFFCISRFEMAIKASLTFSEDLAEASKNSISFDRAKSSAVCFETFLSLSRSLLFAIKTTSASFSA